MDGWVRRVALLTATSCDGGVTAVVPLAVILGSHLFERSSGEVSHGIHWQAHIRKAAQSKRVNMGLGLLTDLFVPGGRTANRWCIPKRMRWCKHHLCYPLARQDIILSLLGPDFPDFYRIVFFSAGRTLVVFVAILVPTHE